jgi:hypothetical protein
MSNKLNKSLDSLRAVVPTLNAITDEANAIVQSVEKALVKEMGIGISACSAPFAETRRRFTDSLADLTIETETRSCLAFGRVGGAFCIHIATVKFRQEDQSDSFQDGDWERTPWSQCDRESRLRAFEKLPSLIDEIVQEAQKLVAMGQETAARVKELIGDDESKPAAAQSVERPVTTNSMSSAGPRNVLSAPTLTAIRMGFSQLKDFPNVGSIRTAFSQLKDFPNLSAIQTECAKTKLSTLMPIQAGLAAMKLPTPTLSQVRSARMMVEASKSFLAQPVLRLPKL